MIKHSFISQHSENIGGIMKKLVPISLLVISIVACDLSDTSDDVDDRGAVMGLLEIDAECPLVSSELGSCVENMSDRYEFRRNQYTLSEVIEACEGAYDNGQQIDTCISNVCGHFGCSEW